MQFVDEEYGSGAGHFESSSGVFENSSDLFYAACGGVKLDKLGAGRAGDDLRQGGFADAGRAVEDEALESVGLDHPPEELAGADKVLLSDEFVESARAHTLSQRGGLLNSLAEAVVEKVLCHNRNGEL